jgi:hypothetical protein
MLLTFLIYIGTALLVVNQRIGWNDTGGPNWLAVLFRSDIWFAFAAIVALPYLRKTSFEKHSKIVLLIIPFGFLISTLLSSVYNLLLNKVFADAFGLYDLCKCIISTIIGFAIYRISQSSFKFRDHLIQILVFAPAIYVVAGLVFISTGNNDIPFFDKDPYDLNPAAGIIGLGNRFQGLASNPNIVAMQSTIAMCLIFPRFFLSGKHLLQKCALAAYAVSLFAIMMWTGVRALAVIFPSIFLIYLWMASSFNKQGFLRGIKIAGLAGSCLGLFFVLINSLQCTQVIQERFSFGDGRIFLWIYYGEMLLHNPIGFGLGFESIVDTDVSGMGLRLPPHNAILQAGMYAGYAGAGLTLFLIYKVIGVIIRVKQAIRCKKPTHESDGVALAWCSLVTNLMFGGMLLADFNFSILTGLLLAQVSQIDRGGGLLKSHSQKENTCAQKT